MNPLNDPVAAFIVLFAAVIVLAALVAGVSLLRDWLDRRRAVGFDRHVLDCRICNPQLGVPQQRRPDVDDAGRWVR